LNTKKKATATSCRCFFRWNTTIEKNDDMLLSSFSSSQTQRRKQQQ
jgi:hypothetical protein